MAKRPSLQAAIDAKKVKKTAAVQASEVSTPPKTRTTTTTTPRAPSREGKVNVSAYFPPEVKSSIRLVQAKRGGNMTDLLGEALNLLFAKHGVPECAPQGD